MLSSCVRWASVRFSFAAISEFFQNPGCSIGPKPIMGPCGGGGPCGGAGGFCASTAADMANNTVAKASIRTFFIWVSLLLCLLPGLPACCCVQLAGNRFGVVFHILCQHIGWLHR